MMKLLACVCVLLAAEFALSVPIKHTRNSLSMSDDLARNKFFPLAAGAYSENPENCIKNRFKNGKVQKKVKVVCSDGTQAPDNCFGFTALLKDDKAIVLAFRGTHGFIQLLDEFNHILFKDKVNVTAGGQVANYFYTVYESVMDNGLMESFKQLVTANPDYDVWITGHSLGGALASIAASELIALELIQADRVNLITFGQPRTGDENYAAAHDKLVPVSYRVTHEYDIVPHMPCEKCEDYYHHKSEIWYNNKMNVGDTYIECDEDESEKCSDGSIWKYSIPDHLYYYNVFVTGYGFNGCV